MLFTPLVNLRGWVCPCSSRSELHKDPLKQDHSRYIYYGPVVKAFGLVTAGSSARDQHRLTDELAKVMYVSKFQCLVILLSPRKCKLQERTENNVLVVVVECCCQGTVKPAEGMLEVKSQDLSGIIVPSHVTTVVWYWFPLTQAALDGIPSYHYCCVYQVLLWMCVDEREKIQPRRMVSN